MNCVLIFIVLFLKFGFSEYVVVLAVFESVFFLKIQPSVKNLKKPRSLEQLNQSSYPVVRHLVQEFQTDVATDMVAPPLRDCRVSLESLRLAPGCVVVQVSQFKSVLCCDFTLIGRAHQTQQQRRYNESWSKAEKTLRSALGVKLYMFVLYFLNAHEFV